MEFITGRNDMAYRIGTLVYTRAALFNVFFWMLLGDMCFSIMGWTPNSIIPLQLKWLGASDKLIGVVVGSLPAVFSVVLAPIIGMQSDRHRGPLGRRRPFLLWFTPPVVLCLILIGFSGPIGRFIHARLGDSLGGISVEELTKLIICLFSGLFFFLNTYINQAYYFLFADVIPSELMGKFVGFYRAIGAIAGFVFYTWIVGYAEKYTGLIYTGSALIFGVVFILLVWQVKEGQYPPIVSAEKKAGFVGSLKLYATECFSIPFYLKLYSIALFFWFAWVPFTAFIVFFCTEVKTSGYAPTLGLTLDAFGKIKGWCFMLQIPIFFLAGPLIDRFHPLRVIMASSFVAAVTWLLSFFCVHSGTSLLVWWLVNEAAQAVFLAAYLAMFPRLLPQAKYGQYFSANQVYFSVGMMLSPYLCGCLLDGIKNYRYLYLWSGIFMALSLLAAISVYRHWKRLGGDQGYSPPEKLSTGGD
jgi:maltose/moltooligosaccharide transporter